MTDIATKICTVCGVEKSVSDFTKGKGACKKCCSEKTKRYNAEHKEERQAYSKVWNENNKERRKEKDAIRWQNNKAHINAVHAIWVENNREHLSEYNKEFRAENADYLREYNRLYLSDRRKNDPVFKLRKQTSSRISTYLRSVGSGKNRQSLLKHLEYSFDELKTYLENQFESWMTWDNYGIYDPKTWNDSDSSTWTWNIDHIVPHSDLPYSSMEDNNFKKCWALDNLRPISAKQNTMDGVSGIRHAVKRRKVAQ